MRRVIAKIARVGVLKPVARTRRTVRKIREFAQGVNEQYWRDEKALASSALRTGTSKSPSFDMDRLVRAERKLGNIQERKLKK